MTGSASCYNYIIWIREPSYWLADWHHPQSTCRYVWTAGLGNKKGWRTHRCCLVADCPIQDVAVSHFFPGMGWQVIDLDHLMLAGHGAIPMQSLLRDRGWWWLHQSRAAHVAREPGRKWIHTLLRYIILQFIWFYVYCIVLHYIVFYYILLYYVILLYHTMLYYICLGWGKWGWE